MSPNPAWRAPENRLRLLVALLLAAPLMGLIGVVAAEAVPNDRIASNLVIAKNRGEFGVAFPTISPLGTRADAYTECAIVLVGLGDPPGNPIKQALFSPWSYSGCPPAARYLDQYAETGELPPLPEKLRYWHGYAVLTRPALALFGLTSTRWLAFGVLALAIVAFARTVAIRYGLGTTAIMLVPGLLTTDMIVGGWWIHQAIGLATAWIAGLIVITQLSVAPRWQVASVAAALGGAINAYFDVMVAIPGSIALSSVAAAFVFLGRGERGAAVVGPMVGAAGGWVVGFTGMWVAKWVFAWLFVDRQQVVDSVRHQIEFRTGGESAGTTGTRLDGLIVNVSQWWERPLTRATVIVTLAILIVDLWRYVRSQRDLGVIAWLGAYMAVVIVPVALWHVIANNTVQVHASFMHRSVGIVFGALAALVLATTKSGTDSIDHPSNVTIESAVPKVLAAPDVA